MVLRRKPDGNYHNALSKGNFKSLGTRQTSNYPVDDVTWRSCSRFVLLLGGKSCSNLQTRDLILQLIERILSVPKTPTFLLNSVVQKVEQLMPPFAFVLFLKVTFPSSSAHVKATERFEALYPTLKEVALVVHQERRKTIKWLSDWMYAGRKDSVTAISTSDALGSWHGLSSASSDMILTMTLIQN
ncbi:hypothetical protein LXL04_037550 [Taraxacum kok-saghyz]